MTVRPPDQTGEDALDQIVERIFELSGGPLESRTARAEKLKGIFEQVGWVHIDPDDGHTIRHTFVATSFVDPKWDQPVFRLRPGAS